MPPNHISIKVLQDLPTIHADMIRLQQVFQNIIDNAIQFIGKKKEVENSGTGLSIAEQYDGSIWIDSEIGIGSIVYFSLSVKTINYT